MFGLNAHIYGRFSTLLEFLPHKYLLRLEDATIRSVGKNFDPGIEYEVNSIFDFFELYDLPFKTVIDVGANIGDFASCLSSRNPHAVVYCIEPEFENYKILARRFENIPTVHTYNFALGEFEASKVSLYAANSGSSQASLSKRSIGLTPSQFGHVNFVDLKTLDQFKSDLGIESIDLVKIDVEGHEFEVLKGAEPSISLIQAIQFEFGGTYLDSGYQFRDVFGFFQKNKFDIFRLAPRGYIPVSKYLEKDEQYVYSNYLAVQSYLLVK